MRLCVPDTDGREVEEIAKVLSTGYLTQGPKVEEFERMVAELIGSRYAFAMSSCTTALHLSLVVLGIAAGDEVLIADFAFPATANVAVQQGAIPVFVDIDLDTYTMNADDLLSKITKRTKAIMPVHAFACAPSYKWQRNTTSPLWKTQLAPLAQPTTVSIAGISALWAVSVFIREK